MILLIDVLGRKWWQQNSERKRRKTKTPNKKHRCEHATPIATDQMLLIEISKRIFEEGDKEDHTVVAVGEGTVVAAVALKFTCLLHKIKKWLSFW